MKIIGVIPARLASTRLSEKVLRPIAGIPMIQHVWQRASQAKKLEKVIVACDDASIEACVKGFGGTAILTRTDHPNGTARIAEIAANEKADVFINIQGDEPLIDADNIDLLAGIFEGEPAVQVATLAVKGQDAEEFRNPNVVKVVCDDAGNALYFSRSPVPHHREEGTPLAYKKHLGIYGYRKEFLLDFVNWPAGQLEHTEKLEQLRILEKGTSIRVLETSRDSLSVDTEEDLKTVESLLAKDSSPHKVS